MDVESYPISYLLALLGAHPILHVSRIRVKYRPTWQHYFGRKVFVTVDALRLFIHLLTQTNESMVSPGRGQATLIAEYLFSNDDDIWSFLPTKSQPPVDFISPSVYLLLSSGLYCSVGPNLLLGYGYMGAKTDTTQETNMCLGKHCRNMCLHLNRRLFCPLQRHWNSMRTAASIWPDCRLETNSLCWRQTVGGDNISVVSVLV
jgi:hypothetical protein